MSQADSSHLLPLIADYAAEAAALHAKCFVQGWPAEAFRNFAEDANCSGFLAWQEKRTVVGLVIARMGGDEGEILTIATDPALRRKGIAGKLLSSMIERLACEGMAVVFLEVGITNGSAIALYESFRFEAVGKRVGYYGHVGGREDALIMRRIIKDLPSI